MVRKVKKIKVKLLLVLAVALLFLILGCTKSNTDETVSYSEYSFTDTSWIRKVEHDIETIRFGSDGSFVYYCACGNSVNDSDLSEGFTYDDVTKKKPNQKVETALKLQGGSKSAIEIASQAVRKCGHVALVGVYGTKYNNFPLGNFFTRNITLKMGQCPATRYVEPILEKIKNGEFDATDIITHTLSLEQGRHAYEIFDSKEDNCIKVVLKP